ncbi:membrane protein [Ligilactobacillus salitolerans]|uniref:Membrane protein n=1 Tax=Ligilactobacillus salitolerans TaxID=1808352 RepID=A0A401ISF1_9LACO|nr:Bax inhibitor-1/YccA family protein [Ligilactobacillus salitolerans]GBG94472.1 membrane protein [Ligilactobacillus salitolerans]
MNNSNQTYTPEASGLNRFFTKMYGFMAGAVAVSALVAFLCASVFPMQVINFFAGSMWSMLLLFAVQLVMVFAISFKPDRSGLMSASLLFAFAGVEGLFLSVVLLVYDIGDISMAFVAASADFIVMAILGAVTKRDLTRIGTQALAALIALIVVSIINIFLQSAMITYFFAFIGVIIFTIMTAWDSQTFKNMYLEYGSQVNTTSLAVSGALQLYLDFINLFLQLLSIFSGGKGSKN